MANKIIYPIVGGTIKNMNVGSGATLTNGDYIYVSGDNEVKEATGAIHGIVLDAPKSDTSPVVSVVSVLLFGNAVTPVDGTIGDTPAAGDFLKSDGSGELTKDVGGLKTVDSLAQLLDAANKVVLIL